jgi:hypothetical protein
MFGILISDHNKYGVGSDPTKVSETDMNAFRQRVLDAQKNYYQKELDLINQDYISSGYPDQARTLEEYMRSIGAYAKGGRAGYAYGGRGYSDYASPSSTTASQDFATQAVSGGQTNYDGGGGSYDYIPQPTVAKLNTDPIKGGDNIPAWAKHAMTTLAMRGSLNKRPITNYGFQTGADFQLNFPNLDPRVTAVLASGYQLGQEGLRSLNPFGGNFLDFKGAFNTAQESAAKNIEGALAADLNVLSPEEIASGREYAESVGINNNVYINKARGGRVNYANGGRGYSDFASPSSTTASQDFATEAVSGGQTDYDGGGDNQSLITPRLPDPNRRKEKAKNFILSTADAFARATLFPYNVVRSAQGISSVLNKAGLIDRDYLALENLIKQQQTGFNPNASPTSDTADLTYGQMRTGGTFDITNTGGDNQPIIPRIPMVAETPTDVDGTLSDLDIYISNLRAAQPNPFMLDSRFAAAQGGVARQAYGLGSLVRKITRPIKKILKSNVGKAALAGAAIYGLGGGKFFGKNLPGLSLAHKDSFDLKNILPNLFGYGYEEKENMYEGLLGKAGLTKGYGEKGLTGIGKTALIAGPSALAYFTTPEEEEEDLSGITSREDDSGLKELIARYPELRFQVQPQYQLAANGGRMGYEEGGNIDPTDLPMSRESLPTYEDIETGEEVEYPYENKEMASEPNIDAELFQMYLDAIGSGKIPRSTTFDQYKELMGEKASMSPERTMANEGGLMSLGGNEMDLRGGGFVPLGAKEKADDVPARLSKNEFVFTADAVRAAGGGDVDRGANLMYKTMKNLESRVG